MRIGYKPTEKPSDADWYISPSYYKATPQGKVYVWGGDFWVRSTKSKELMEAEVLRDIYSKINTKEDGQSYMKRINKNLIINEYRALVYTKVYKKSPNDASELMGICHSTIGKYIKAAEKKLGSEL